MLQNLIPMDPSLLREKIKKKLAEKKLKVNQVEKLAGLGGGAIRQFLSGRTNNPTWDTLRAVSKVLELEFSELTNEYSKNNISKSLDFSWKSEMFSKITLNLQDFINKHNYSISGTEAISIIQNIYCFCLENKEEDIDKAFAELLLKKMIEERVI